MVSDTFISSVVAPVSIIYFVCFIGSRQEKKKTTLNEDKDDKIDESKDVVMDGKRIIDYLIYIIIFPNL